MATKRFIYPAILPLILQYLRGAPFISVDVSSVKIIQWGKTMNGIVFLLGGVMKCSGITLIVVGGDCTTL